jgi:hypothetical protein
LQSQYDVHVALRSLLDTLGADAGAAETFKDVDCAYCADRNDGRLETQKGRT